MTDDDQLKPGVLFHFYDGAEGLCQVLDVNSVQVSSRLVESQDMCRGREGFSEGHSDDDGGKDFLPHGASAFHFDKLTVLLHHNAIAIPIILFLGYRVNSNEFDILSMVNLIPYIIQYFVYLVHLLVVKSVCCSFHCLHC